MKKACLPIILLALLCPFLRAQGEGFILRGRIAGMPDGVSVALLTGEELPSRTLAETTVRKGRFELRWKLDHPTVCTLITNNLGLVSKDSALPVCWTYTPVFVDNVRMTVETPHYDSIPHDAAVSSSFRITGGEIQRDFTDWHLLLAGRDEERECAWEFITSHPHSAVSAWLGNRLMRRGYNLTIDEVERLENAIPSVPADPIRFATFRQNCAYARQTAKYRPLVDLELNDIKGQPCRLTEVIPSGRIVLVDFWATWCGPCMAAIAPIRDLAERYPERLAVVGVSCDENIAAWKAAIEKKKARWPQYVLTKQGYKDMLEKYQISGVPYFLVLDEKGRVISNPKHVEEIRRTVEELCRGDGFVFRGELEPTADTLYLSLVNKEAQDYPVLACETLVGGGAFRLCGRVASPVMGELRVSKKDPQFGLCPVYTVQVLIGNDAYFVEFPSLDRTGNAVGPVPEVRVCGGPMQRQLQAYSEKLAPFQKELNAWSMKALEAYFGVLEADSVQIVKEAQRLAGQRIDSAAADFVRNHPQTAIAAWWVQQKMYTYFQLTAAEQEAYLEAIGKNEDTARVNRIRHALPNLRRYARLTPYTDFKAATPSGEMAALSELREPDKYVLIDFWASWCGPCRQAIPRVKELRDRYDSELQVISVSADQKENDWQKALGEEQMEWKQLRLAGPEARQAAVGYGLSSIPYLVLIAPDGRILCATNDPGEVCRSFLDAAHPEKLKTDVPQ